MLAKVKRRFKIPLLASYMAGLVVCQVHDRHGIESLFGVEPVRFDLLGPVPQVGRVHTKIPHIPLQSKLMVTP